MVPKLSVVVTTKNEAANIGNCLAAFNDFRDQVELIVVDNASTDDTKAIAAKFGAVVLDKGPERSAQRNLGWRTAKADWVVVLDADMILPPETIKEMIGENEEVGIRNEKLGIRNEKLGIRNGEVDAYWIPEVRTGSGIRTKARNFERSFYDGTCVDALRLFSKKVLLATGGYDEKLIAGPEDWELDIRILATGAHCEVMRHNLIHNEAKLTFKRMLEKKAYYTKSFDAYKAKWPNHPAVKKQFSAWYRFVGVFVEQGKWKRLLAHPILAAVMYFDRIAVGIVYLTHK